MITTNRPHVAILATATEHPASSCNRFFERMRKTAWRMANSTPIHSLGSTKPDIVITNITPEQCATMAARYRSGESINQIGRSFGYTYSVVRRVLKRQNVAMRQGPGIRGGRRKVA